MIFEIPEDLTVFTVAALTQKTAEATTEYNTLLASMQADEAARTSENFDSLDALKNFRDAAKTEIDSRSANAARMGQHAVLTDEQPVTEPAVTETPVAVEPPAAEFAAPRVAELAPTTPATPADQPVAPSVFGRMFAASNVEGYSAGQELPGLMDLTKAFLSKVRTFNTLGALHAQSEPISYQVATLSRDYPAEFSVSGADSDDEILRNVTNEFRLDSQRGLLGQMERRYKELADTQPQRDSLVAATGWCAPSETLYDTCFQGVVDGLFDAPEVQARRGGIRHNQGIDFLGVYGSGTGFFNLSEAQVIAGTAKTCIEIPCPSFIDDRLGVTGLCITGNILQNRGYPEFVRDWMRAAMVASAHQINSLQIAAVVADSVAVNLGTAGLEPWSSDGTVTAQVLAAVEMAIMDIRYRLRMGQSATLEVVLPYWLLAQFRADLARQNGGDALARQAVTNQQIISWFTMRGARVQWVYDWQDAFAPTDLVNPATQGGPGAATAITSLPGGVKFLVYPTGTWVRAVNDVITLNAIYDSTKLVTNQLTQLFTETGWKMMRMCPLSRVYTVNICPSGNTGAQRAVSCVTP
jgi:hypothetical protein